MIRLDKYLADMGAGTRQEVKKYIRQGRVKTDGVTVKRPEQKIDENTQRVWLDDIEISYTSYEYYMLNKPAGVVSATEDTKERTVIELIESRKRKDLFPAGRLDKDTEGLLLITNDGVLAHSLLSPKNHVDKCYYAKVTGHVNEEDMKAFSGGLNIGTQEKEEWTRPAVLEVLSCTGSECTAVSEIRLTIHEGKYHQVKRMFQAVGKEVLYLKRERMGTLELDENLKPGEYRALTEEELNRLWGRC